MPRSALAGPVPAASKSIDYFDTLQDLAEYSATRLRQNRQPPPHPIRHEQGEIKDKRGRLLVCHDYKGGYSERNDERGYTFQFWHLCDTHIYFSHHRISTPPPSWIRTAHRHGTRILGTLIFEWDAGREDIVELVDPGGNERITTFEKLDFRYADLLVDLAVEKGFDGWLVNVEVDLGGERDEAGNRRKAEEHARLLIAWLTYLTREMHRRIPGSEVMWYDAVTQKGKLQWQNTLNEKNTPFLIACDSIFLNYFWTPALVAATLMVLPDVKGVNENQIYFGIDMFGRGSYGGGGFESWRALEAIYRGRTDGEGLSVALFAPGWTVESSDLKHSLSTAEVHKKWLEDEMYLWQNGSATSNVPLEAARMRKVRQDQAGIQRARQLAAALYRDPRIPLSFRPPLEPLEFKLKSLPDPPDNFRSICRFIAAPRPVPTNGDTFYTNFSSGEGHSFCIKGEEVDRTETGWTDVDYTFPFPSSLLHRSIEGVKVEFVDGPKEVWEGNRGVKVEVEQMPNSGVIPLIALDYPIREGRFYHTKVNYRPLKGEWPDYTPEIRVHFDVRGEEEKKNGYKGGPICHEMTMDSPPYADEDGDYMIDESDGRTADEWTETTAVFEAPHSTRITQLSMLFFKPPISVIIGSVSVYPAPTTDGPQPIMTSLHFSDSTASLVWSTSLFYPPSLRPDYSEHLIPSDPQHVIVPSFVQYHLYRRKGGVGEKEEYLGTTRETEFAIERDRLKGYEVVVKGVKGDGSEVEAVLSFVSET